MRYGRLHTSSTDPWRPQGDLRTTNRPHFTGATDRFSHRESRNYFFRPPISVPLIFWSQYLTERYSNGCMPRFIIDSNSLHGFHNPALTLKVARHSSRVHLLSCTSRASIAVQPGALRERQSALESTLKNKHRVRCHACRYVVARYTNCCAG